MSGVNLGAATVEVELGTNYAELAGELDTALDRFESYRGEDAEPVLHLQVPASYGAVGHYILTLDDIGFSGHLAMERDGEFAWCEMVAFANRDNLFTEVKQRLDTILDALADDVDNQVHIVIRPHDDLDERYRAESFDEIR